MKVPWKALWLWALAVAPMCTVHAHPGKVDRDGCHREAKSEVRHCHPTRAQTLPQRPASPSIPPRAGEEGVFDGSVLWVADGDSLRVLVKGRNMAVRLADIDAPEREQPYGWQAKIELIDLVRDRHAILVPRDVDQYGRIVARVWVGGVDVNREMVKRGAAWFYPAYAEDAAVYYDEQDARASRLGLWALAPNKRIEPWEWRRRQRQPAGDVPK